MNKDILKEVLRKHYNEAHSWEYNPKELSVCKNCGTIRSVNPSEPCINWDNYLEELKELNKNSDR